MARRALATADNWRYAGRRFIRRAFTAAYLNVRVEGPRRDVTAAEDNLVRDGSVRAEETNHGRSHCRAEIDRGGAGAKQRNGFVLPVCSARASAIRGDYVRADVWRRDRESAGGTVVADQVAIR